MIPERRRFSPDFFIANQKDAQKMSDRSDFDRHVDDDFAKIGLTGDGIKPHENQYFHIAESAPTEEDINTIRLIASDWGLTTGCTFVFLDVTYRGEPVGSRQKLKIVRPKTLHVLGLRTKSEFYAVYEALTLYHDRLTDVVQGDSLAEPSEKSFRQFQKKLTASADLISEFHQIVEECSE